MSRGENSNWSDLTEIHLVYAVFDNNHKLESAGF